MDDKTNKQAVDEGVDRLKLKLSIIADSVLDGFIDNAFGVKPGKSFKEFAESLTDIQLVALWHRLKGIPENKDWWDIVTREISRR